ncbi:homocysteine S-methyltransferase [Roseibacterium elongatum DSM 19469]|uniref:Homocysteine S-methyltransferase n=1 Tax=Roseicyclus elongatus DSM 19469 TaxID=1294273 RepID=W8RPK2_9RHOB|nr:hypothetical protein [Roseibacterium elongatum]AHM02923.1 homocysteine S-methyltransferase [Roseibacterium elongatum DSM 19469]
MTRKSGRFPDVTADLLLAYLGMETDLIFNRGVDLPGFASFPLLETPEGRDVLTGYMVDIIALGFPWVANRDRAADLGADRY